MSFRTGLLRHSLMLVLIAFVAGSLSAADGEQQADARLRVLTLNLHTYQEISTPGVNESDLTDAMARDRITSYGAILDRIAAGIDGLDPDIICLQEVGEWAAATSADDEFGLHDSNMVQQILSRLPGHDYHVTMDWSHLGWGVWREGSAILSKFPIVHSESRFISSNGASRYDNWKSRNVPMARVDTGASGALNVFSVHAGWWDDPEEPSEQQFRRLRAWTDAMPDGPAILCGDFNAPAGGPAYELLTTELGFIDHYLLANPDGMFDATITGGADGWEDAKAGSRIDYVFSLPGRSLEVVSARRVFTASDMGQVSDHAGIFAEFSIEATPQPADLAQLGRALYFDTALSAPKTQSCATCHDPAWAFSDPRDNGVGGAVSLGADGRSLGSRNAPSLSYRFATPPFHVDNDGNYVGGLFLDGRAETIVEQAKGPLLNAIEMALPDPAALRDRILANPRYVSAFSALMGPASLESPERTLASVTTAIATFEGSDAFSPFDSRYDRYLRGETALTREQELGRILFFSDLINCNRCHLLDRRERVDRELFTNHRYHNIGIPASAHGSATPDTGLLMNPRVDDAAQAGRFRVPSLRNVAVTGPYMHNGVFQQLETAILYYNRFLLIDDANNTNPETGQPWRPAEVPVTMDIELLREGQPLTQRQVELLVAFLETLTDRRYEHLLLK
jgi:cytochrome c peroxidase